MRLREKDRKQDRKKGLRDNWRVWKNSNKSSERRDKESKKERKGI